MEVTVYGVRGSIPIPGPSTLRYGGNTVHVAVRLGDGTHIILDAGTGIRDFGKDLLTAEERPRSAHFLLSHRHYDHVIGLPFFEPMYDADFELMTYPVLGVRPRIFDGVQTPLSSDDLPATIRFRDAGEGAWDIGSARVSRIELNHPGGAQGFRIDDEGGASITYLTDNELNPPGTRSSTPEEQAAFARGTGLLIIDAQYLPADLPEKRGWGHSTVPEVLQLGRAAQPLTQLLFHHDPDRDDAQLDAIAEQAREFGDAELVRGPILVASEGMRFEIDSTRCRRLADRG